MREKILYRQHFQAFRIVIRQHLATIRERVAAAPDLHSERIRKNKGVSTNASMSAKLMREHCALDATSTRYLEHTMEQMNFSASARIQSENILEAIKHRSLDQKRFP